MDVGVKKPFVGFYLLLVLAGLCELAQGGGELPNQIVAPIHVPVVATHLHSAHTVKW